MIRQFTFISFLFLGLSTFAQSYNYTQFTTEDGLPSSEVYHVFQDSKGYIWFATDNGVSRFDGYKFKNFTIEDGLPDNTIFEIYEDFEGKLWFISFSAKLSYYHEGNIHLYKHNSIIKNNIIENPVPIKKTFFVDTNNTVYYCDRDNGIFQINTNGELLKKNSKYLLYINPNNVLINKFSIYDSDSFPFQFHNKECKDKLVINKKLRARYFRTATKLKNKVAFSYNKIIFTIQDSVIFHKKEFPYAIIWLSNHNSNLWVGTTNGVYCYKDFNIDSEPVYSLFKGKSISSVLIDNENGAWFSTLSDGVYFIPELKIESLTTNNSNLSSNRVDRIDANSNDIWFGLNDGCIGKLKDGKPIPKVKLLETKFCQELSSLKCNDKGDIYISSSCKVYKISPINNKKNIQKQTQYKLSEISHVGAKTIHHISDTVSYLCMRGGLYKFTHDKFSSVHRVNNQKSTYIYSILTISRNRLLLGCDIGLWESDIYLQEFKEYPNNHIGLKDRINCLEKTNNDSLIWVGTKAYGIIVIDADTTYNISTKDGLNSNFITSFFNNNDTMWVGTKGGGAYMINLDNKTFNIQSLNIAHGLLSNEINDIYVNDSSAFIATNKGLNIIKHGKYKPNFTPPPIYIEHIKINSWDTILLDQYTLGYNKNSFEIKLTGLAYKQLGNVKYKYRLTSSSKDTNWISTTSRNIQLSYIPPGNYTFQAKAINENNIESEMPVEIRIRIKPPFWKTWWFISLMFIIAIALTSIILLIIYRIRIREIEKRNQLEKEFIENKNLLQQEIEKFRQQALSQQMNPHFIFNSLNSIQYFIYQNEKALSNKYLTKFSRLIRIILENSQHQAIPLKDEFEALQLYLELEEMRLQGKLKFTIEIDKSINLEFYTIPPLLIQPFAENAIWHGIVNKKDKGKVIIKLIENTDHFTCIIEDDGVGREKAKEIQARKQKLHKSLGASITERRLSLLNSTYGEKNTISYTDLTNDGAATGTRVEIKMPKVSMDTI